MGRDALMSTVAANIEAAMVRKGTNSSEVARRAGVGPTGVYDIVKGKSKHPRLDTLRKIAEDGLGIPVTALFVAPGAADIDHEILEAFAGMPLERRRDLLLMARALMSPPTSP